MKTLLISEIFPPRTGGSGRWFYEIYRRMPCEQFLIAAGQHPAAAEFDRGHDAAVVRAPLSLDAWGMKSWRGLCGYARAARAIRRIVRAERVERLHCGRMLPEGWIAWLLNRLRRTAYVCYVHGEETNYGVLSRELGWMMRRVLRGAEGVIANSHNTADILRRNWQVPESKIRVLHPGVDTDFFRPAAPDPVIRRRLGWDERPVILTVGRLQERKGHDQMILALRQVRQAIPDVLYAIVGAGERRQFLESLVQREALKAHVQFLGEMSDPQLIDCYQQCDLFVLPNREVQGDIEGFGMVLLEAQACGKPVVAGASGGTAETMQPGITGAVVSCDTPDRLAALAIDLLNDPPRRAAMGAAARQWTVDHFGWEALCVEAREVFGERRWAERADAAKPPMTEAAQSVTEKSGAAV